MNRLLTVSVVIGGIFLLLFFCVEALHLPFLEQVDYLLRVNKFWAACIGVGLLVADLVAPVPNSLIMIMMGGIFGIVGGTLISVFGGWLSVLVGYWLGQKGLANNKLLFKSEDMEAAEVFFDRWGIWAISLSRPIPILAETLSIMAGVSGIGVSRASVYSLLGLFPPALIYAITGAYSTKPQWQILSFLLVMLLTTLFWLLGKRISPKPSNPG